MPPRIPTGDGEINVYNLSNSENRRPRIYFVNGIRVLPRDHAITASLMSLLIERPIHGVYNKTAGQYLGSVGDLVQCVFDYTQNATARVGSGRRQGKPGRVAEEDIPDFLNTLGRRYVVWNKATLALFRDLVENRHRMKYVIAHSQGNLITSNALFAIEAALGPEALANVRVFSLASPAPAWPVGLRKTHGGGGRQVNSYMNDAVVLLRPHNLAAKFGLRKFQNAGDFRTHEPSGPVSLAPHDVTEIVATLNFLKSIRGELGLPPDVGPDLLDRSSAAATAAFPEQPKGRWDWLLKWFR